MTIAMTKTVKLSAYAADFVADLGVGDIFILPGGGAMHLNDSFGNHPRLKYVCNLHEQACAISADAYGQYTNNLGVAMVTTGPGSTNAITGVAAAWLDSTPCLFISGQVKRADIVGARGVRQMGFQEIDIVRIVKPITKYAVTVTEPEKIRYHLEAAAWHARNGRPGPVWVDIPLDVQNTGIVPEDLERFIPTATPPLDLGDAVRRTVALLEQAERPVILAGNGVRLAKALPEFHKLIRRLNIPVLTTWKALDFLAETDPVYCGRPGATGQRGANFTQQNSDLLLVLGARMDYGQTGYNHANFARCARKVVVDIDEAEIRKMLMEIEVPVAAGADLFLRGLLKELEGRKLPDWSGWVKRCKELQAQYPICLDEYWARKDYVDNYVLVEVLSELMTPEDMLIPGSSGACSEITMQAFKCKAGQRVFNSEGLGPMGFGIAAAIGGCVASGGRRTVCIDGDGGWVMNFQELEVVRRLNLPVKIFVLNNNGYGSIRASQRNYFNSRFVASEPGSGLTLPSVQAVAEAFRLPGFHIANHEAIREQMSRVLSLPGPAVCEVMISPDQATMPRITSRLRADGTMASAPLEDMAPFLDREEFQRNMLIPILEE